MTQEEYFSINWHRGNMVQLNNGKEYLVKGVKKKVLVLYSEEYEAYFVADYRIIACRTSDFEDNTPREPKPAQVTVEKKIDTVEPAEKKKDAEQPKVVEKSGKAEMPADKVKPVETPVKKVAESPVPTEIPAAATTEAPVKKKRKRITITRPVVERVDYK